MKNFLDFISEYKFNFNYLINYTKATIYFYKYFESFSDDEMVEQI